VFPVPDGDTGTNMAFTFKTILEATRTSPDDRVDDLMDHVAEAALDGARGNSGAIMAQYFHGFREAVAGRRMLTAEGFAEAAESGARAAWTAMSKPVQGTLPTVLEDFSKELSRRVAEGARDIQSLLSHGIERAQKSLANTPNQLPALKHAGVVDAGGQGFVDLLEGIWTFIQKGEVDPEVADLQDDLTGPLEQYDVGDHRYCTECVIEGDDLDREAVMARLEELDASSLVVAGGHKRVRVHIHVNNPAEVYLVCEGFGQVMQQKADDMARQNSLLDHPGEVAIVVDSAADIPLSEAERLGIQIVPVRLSFGARDYMDGVSITPEEFYDMLAESDEAPKTSQPPAQDFARVYSLLTSHGYKVISIGVSEQLSGTIDAARQASGREGIGEVRVIDSRAASCSEGLLAMVAAEAAAKGMAVDEIEALINDLIPRARVFGIADDLKYAVRGGRVPAWVYKLTRALHINPVLTASPEGKVGAGGVHFGRGANPKRLAKTLVRNMSPDTMYRVLISHANNEDAARAVRQHILANHGRIHSCHVTDARPALGVHVGPGGLFAGSVPQPDTLNRTGARVRDK
jgi:DegV family protein with EDD domain